MVANALTPHLLLSSSSRTEGVSLCFQGELVCLIGVYAQPKIWMDIEELMVLLEECHSLKPKWCWAGMLLIVIPIGALMQLRTLTTMLSA